MHSDTIDVYSILVRPPRPFNKSPKPVIELTSGRSPLVVVNGCGGGLITPVPYVGRAGGALKGWASVLKTSVKEVNNKN